MKKLKATGIVACVSLLTFTGAAEAANKGDRLTTNQRLVGNNNDFIRSMDGRFSLRMQSDCNLVQYKGSTALWNSGTWNRGKNCILIMQSDGNMVIYRDTYTSGGTLYGYAAWSSNTYNHPGAFVVAQGDGNTVIYDKRNALWATNTWQAPPPNVSIPSGSGGADPHPNCSFARTDTKCIAVLLLCKAVYDCGFDSNFTPVEEDDGWSPCGVCFGS